MIRKLLKWPLRAALGNDWLRPKVIHELEQDYFPELGIVMPLSHGMSCPITRPSNVHSFAEMFIEREYGPLLDHMDLPRRWVDLGCHCGFFSAFIAWHWRMRGDSDFAGLLADADPRVARDVGAMISANQLEKQLRFIPGLIAAGSGERAFGLREAMASSVDVEAPADAFQNVPVLTAERILQLFPGRLDLLKVDIEGAELDLLEHYPALLRQADAFVLEWHCFKPGERTRESVGERLKTHGFEFLAMLQPARTRHFYGKNLVAGCDLYRRAR